MHHVIESREEHQKFKAPQASAAGRGLGPVVKSVLGVQESIQTPVPTLRKARSGASLRSGASGGAQSEFWSRAKAMHTGTDVAY
jgi:hypothetical protein